MNSKDSLEHLCNICDHDCCPYIHYDKSRCVFYGLIRQDLERLEELEKENAKLKNVIEDIKNLPNCDICDSNWHKGCMCLQNKFKKVLLNNNFNHMFDNCKLTPLPEVPELEELQDD